MHMFNHGYKRFLDGKCDEVLVETINEKLLITGKVAKEYLADLEAFKKEHKLIYEKLY
ncbi:hypothetical protein [Clostridium sp.]|uniref:hypothetical protein n=1 Tax=Clostridium sp. TaxID=1506 RepID=UPI002FCC34D3